MTTGVTTRLAHDPAFPRRDDMLDVGCIGGRLTALVRDRTRASIASATLARVNYHAGKGLRAVYRVDSGGATHTIAARMFADADAAERVYARAAAVAEPVDGVQGVGYDPLLSAVFWAFPNDRKIATLAAALAPALPTAAHDDRRVSKRLVAYAPEKAATFVCETAAHEAVAYLKVTADDQAARDRRTYERFQSMLDPDERLLRLPTSLAFSDHPRHLWLEPVTGRRMAASLGTDVELADLEQVGAAIAVFHGLRPGDAPRFDRFAPSEIDADVAMMCLVRPDVGDAARAVARRLIDANTADDDVACLHGDLHPKNVIAGRDGIALIDLETVALGPAAADLGSLLASLVYRRAVDRLSRSACRARAHAFLAGYARRRRLPPRESLAWHTAAALFRERTVRAIKRVRTPGLAVLPALLSASAQLLDRGLEEL